MITSVIVERHEFIRLGLSSLLRKVEHVELLADYSDSGKMLCDIADLNPDIVIISAMEVVADHRICYEVLRLSPSSKVLVMTDEVHDEELLESILLGASAYITKKASLEDVVRTVEIVAAGGTYFETESLAQVLKSFQEQQTLAADANDNLSEREKTILALLAKGYSNGEIGAELHISRSTVRNAITQIRNKLNINTRIELAVYAVQIGIAHSPGRVGSIPSLPELPGPSDLSSC